MKKITFIFPVLNEEGSLPKLQEAVLHTTQKLNQYEYEFIFVNDGSVDSSESMLEKFAENDPRVKVMSFSRNFGHQAALTAGYDIATGGAVITMDADMQDTPDVIPKMLEKWESGAEIVYARRRNRQDAFFKKTLSVLYYKVLESVSDVKIPRNVGDFRLIDRRVLTILRECREKYRYIRGMVAWFGFKSDYVDFDRPNRIHGKTGYTWKKMFKFAFDGLTGFSLFPLKIAAYIGIFVIISGTGLLLYTFYDFAIRHTPYPLYKWLIIVVYIFIGVQFILMWLIGEYIGRIHDEQKGRPLYVLSKTVNVPGNPEYDIHKSTRLD